MEVAPGLPGRDLIRVPPVDRRPYEILLAGVFRTWDVWDDQQAGFQARRLAQSDAELARAAASGKSGARATILESIRRCRKGSSRPRARSGSPRCRSCATCAARRRSASRSRP